MPKRISLHPFWGPPVDLPLRAGVPRRSHASSRTDTVHLDSDAPSPGRRKKGTRSRVAPARAPAAPRAYPSIDIGIELPGDPIGPGHDLGDIPIDLGDDPEPPEGHPHERDEGKEWPEPVDELDPDDIPDPPDPPYNDEPDDPYWDPPEPDDEPSRGGGGGGGG